MNISALRNEINGPSCAPALEAAWRLGPRPVLLAAWHRSAAGPGRWRAGGCGDAGRRRCRRPRPAAGRAGPAPGLPPAHAAGRAARARPPGRRPRGGLAWRPIRPTARAGPRPVRRGDIRPVWERNRWAALPLLAQAARLDPARRPCRRGPRRCWPTGAPPTRPSAARTGPAGRRRRCARCTCAWRWRCCGDARRRVARARCWRCMRGASPRRRAYAPAQDNNHAGQRTRRAVRLRPAAAARRAGARAARRAGAAVARLVAPGWRLRAGLAGLSPAAAGYARGRGVVPPPAWRRRPSPRPSPHAPRAATRWLHRLAAPGDRRAAAHRAPATIPRWPTCRWPAPRRCARQHRARGAAVLRRQRRLRRRIRAAPGSACAAPTPRCRAPAPGAARACWAGGAAARGPCCAPARRCASAPAMPTCCTWSCWDGDARAAARRRHRRLQPAARQRLVARRAVAGTAGAQHHRLRRRRTRCRASGASCFARWPRAGALPGRRRRLLRDWRGKRHARRVALRRPAALAVEDRVAGPFRGARAALAPAAGRGWRADRDRRGRRRRRASAIAADAPLPLRLAQGWESPAYGVVRARAGAGASRPRAGRRACVTTVAWTRAVMHGWPPACHARRCCAAVWARRWRVMLLLGAALRGWRRADAAGRARTSRRPWWRRPRPRPSPSPRCCRPRRFAPAGCSTRGRRQFRRLSRRAALAPRRRRCWRATPPCSPHLTRAARRGRRGLLRALPRPAAAGRSRRRARLAASATSR